MYTFKEYIDLNEGGNITIPDIHGVEHDAARIPLEDIGRKTFVESFQKFFLKLNTIFEKEYNYPLWPDTGEITNAGIFNGSTSFIMSADYSDEEVLKYKKTAGDIDVAFPREYGPDLYNLLLKLRGKELVPGLEYIGNNAKTQDKLGNTIICIVKARYGDIEVSAQVDMELSEFVQGKQTDWSAHIHSSSFEDAKAGIKGAASKFLWRALIGITSQVTDNFLEATPSSTSDKITIKKKQPAYLSLIVYGGEAGVGTNPAYELMVDSKNKPILVNGKRVFRKLKPKERTYDRNLGNLIKIAFGGKIDSKKIPKKELDSFVKTLAIANKYLDKKSKEDVNYRFMLILFGEDGRTQTIEPKNPREDLEIKMAMYNKLIELLKIKAHPQLEAKVNMYMKVMHKS